MSGVGEWDWVISGRNDIVVISRVGLEQGGVWLDWNKVRYVYQWGISDAPEEGMGLGTD